MRPNRPSTPTSDRPGLPAAALVSIDPRTGEILAFDASTNYRKTKFDLPAQARRQAGSSFKPYGLAAAMVDLGIDPETTEYSSQAPFHYPIPGCVGAPSCIWTVNNAESNLTGNFNLHVAMDGSINAVFARLSADIGPTRTVNMAYNLGIPRSDHLPKVYSIILGTGLVSPLDMASAYSTFAANGIHHNPLAITDVTAPTGATIASTPASRNPGRRALPSWAASEMNQILYDNIYTCPSGLCTGSAAALSPYRPAAGKTGTVEAHLDAWFCGYTPNLTTCVWMGFPQGEISMIPAVGSADSFGGGYPALIWHSFMTAALAAEPTRFPADSVPRHPRTGGRLQAVHLTVPAVLGTGSAASHGGGGKHNPGNGNGQRQRQREWQRRRGSRPIDREVRHDAARSSAREFHTLMVMAWRVEPVSVIARSVTCGEAVAVSTSTRPTAFEMARPPGFSDQSSPFTLGTGCLTGLLIGQASSSQMRGAAGSCTNAVAWRSPLQKITVPWTWSLIHCLTSRCSPARTSCRRTTSGRARS